MNESQKEAAIARLNELGVEQVKMLMSHGGLPTEWNATIYEWLREKATDPGAASQT